MLRRGAERDSFTSACVYVCATEYVRICTFFLFSLSLLSLFSLSLSAATHTQPRDSDVIQLARVDE